MTLQLKKKMTPRDVLVRLIDLLEKDPLNSNVVNHLKRALLAMDAPENLRT